jgi:hypothetical protein
MALVPGGSHFGKSDSDLANVEDAQQKTVTVRSFTWMKQNHQQ